MNTMSPPISSPLLDHCPPSLPASWYRDPAQYAREINRIHARNWIYVGREEEFPALTVRRLEVAGQNLIAVKDQHGDIRCFHNACRHRGAELCAAPETKLKSRLITCPYHEWAYGLDGKLVRVPYATPTADFKREDHGLLAVAVTRWNGFVFVCLAGDPPPFNKAPDMGAAALDNWPMSELVIGHTWVHEIACNWKIFWENYNECLHCPGIHPELCDIVPVYRRGIMAISEASDWVPGTRPENSLKPGAVTWTANGKACGPEFPGLSEAERACGHNFVTLWPTMYVVAHVDYVRAVSIRPLGPERMELKAQWLFPRATIDAPGFDLANVTEFAKTVMMQDAAASEMNQRGLRSPTFTQGRLMPQEFDVYRFQQWVRGQLEEEQVS